MDLLAAVNIHQPQLGVSRVTGFCEFREPYNKSDLAFNIKPEAQLSVTTYQVFPGESNFNFS